RTAERNQFLTPYSVSAPTARSNDARPVVADVFVVAPAIPTIPVETKPLAPVPAGPLAAPAPRKSGVSLGPAPRTDDPKPGMVRTGGFWA
ncbi:hypothetical protein ACHWGL_31535, partial [Klebsiella pneumoniae]|uniref:hypothetical protein n=1 Tax=Klebsiella pneumoniae TaxID=573 RepID=UPI00376EA562